MTHLSHCEAPDIPCWECYAPHRAVQRPVKWVIDLAEAALRFRMQTLPSNPEIEDLQVIQDSIWRLINLKGQQWRDCVEAPFTFYPGEGTYEEPLPEAKEKAVSLLAKLGLQRTPSIKRRSL